MPICDKHGIIQTPDTEALAKEREADLERQKAKAEKSAGKES